MKRLPIIAFSLFAALLLCACALQPPSPPEVEGVTQDYAALYTQVLDELWAVDPGLNSNIRYVSVDLSRAPGDLSAESRAAIAQAFAEAHNAQCLTLSYDELAEQGYLSDLNPEDAEHKLYQWDDGVAFSIAPAGSFHDDSANSTSDSDAFDAQKWRSPLGAYFFLNCTPHWAEDGSCLGFDRGGEAIS